MANEKFLCVMAGYDAETEQRISEMYDRVQAAGFTGTQTRGIPFHITLGTFPVEEEDFARRLVEKVSAETPAFPVVFNHIGIFQGGKVLFLAPRRQSRAAGAAGTFRPRPGLDRPHHPAD